MSSQKLIKILSYLIIFVNLVLTQEEQQYYSPCPPECVCKRTKNKGSYRSRSKKIKYLNRKRSKIYKRDTLSDHGRSSHVTEKRKMKHLRRVEFNVICKNQQLKLTPSYLPRAVSTLDLSNNAIYTLNLNDLDGLVNLKRLSYAHNSLSQIPNYWLYYAPRVTFLDLSFNKISYIDSTAFQFPKAGLKNFYKSPDQLYHKFLKSINLEGNLLNGRDTTGRNKLLFNEKMSYINLKNNKISKLSEDSFIAKNFEKVNLDENPIDCGCQNVEWIFQRKQLRTEGSKITCVTPPEFRGFSIINLQSSPKYKSLCTENRRKSTRRRESWIEKPPSSKLLKTGDTVTLTCKTKVEYFDENLGQVVAKFQRSKWYKNRKFIRTSEHFLRPKSPVLIIKKFSPKDQGNYLCKSGNLKTNVKLELVKIPLIIQRAKRVAIESIEETANKIGIVQQQLSSGPLKRSKSKTGNHGNYFDQKSTTNTAQTNSLSSTDLERVKTGLKQQQIKKMSNLYDIVKFPAPDAIQMARNSAVFELSMSTIADLMKKNNQNKSKIEKGIRKIKQIVANPSILRRHKKSKYLQETSKFIDREYMKILQDSEPIYIKRGPGGRRRRKKKRRYQSKKVNLSDFKSQIRPEFFLQNRFVDFKNTSLLNNFEFYHEIPEIDVFRMGELAGCIGATPKDIERAQEKCQHFLRYHAFYRTHSGICNNLDKPWVGNAYTPFKRWLPAIYENRFNLPVGWMATKKYHGFVLPKARDVSHGIIASTTKTNNPRKALLVKEDPVHTHMLMQWGQFLDHDITLTPVSPVGGEIQLFSNDGRKIHCEDSCKKSIPCFPMEFSKEYDQEDKKRRGNQKCMKFVRSAATCGTGYSSLFFDDIAIHEQINELTSFIDGSMIYGSSEPQSRRLRASESVWNGLLREGQTIKLLDGTMSKPMLPFDDPERRITVDGETVLKMDCKRNSFLEKDQDRKIDCYLSGDIRANEQTGLTVLHTIFFRFHNIVAKKLTYLNPHWVRTRNKIYNEARKIVSSLVQKITYDDWLPEVFFQNDENPPLSKYHNFSSYNPDIIANVANVFATAAFRFGHTLINNKLYRLDSDLKPIRKYGHLDIHKSFFAPYHLHNYGGIDPVLRGLIFNAAKNNNAEDLDNSADGKYAGLLTDELTERLFKMNEKVSLDLAAINIQRGRDHALPFYKTWRKFCNLPSETDQQILSDIPKIYHQKIRNVYQTPQNLEAFPGFILERKISKNSKVGPTLACLLKKQFEELRDGDRFFFEKAHVFKMDQLQALKKMSLAQIICLAGDKIDRVKTNVFRIDSEIVDCRDVLKDFDLSAWIDMKDSRKDDVLQDYES